jgi:hypothetical protein
MATASTPAHILVRALHTWNHSPADQPQQCLSIRKGDLVRVVAQSGAGWYDGVRAGRRGWLPSSWVEEVVVASPRAGAAGGVRPRAVVARL